MLRFVQATAAVLFYLLAGSFFLAYVLAKNDIGGVMPEWWLRVGDLAVLFVGILYGGTSVYGSLTAAASPSRALALTIGLPLIVVFLFFLLVNFGLTFR